jgi:hypothetical protein
MGVIPRQRGNSRRRVIGDSCRSRSASFSLMSRQVARSRAVGANETGNAILGETAGHSRGDRPVSTMRRAAKKYIRNSRSVADREDRAWRDSHDPLSDTPEDQMCEPAPPVSSHHDQVGASGGRRVRDDASRTADDQLMGSYHSLRLTPSRRLFQAVRALSRPLLQTTASGCPRAAVRAWSRPEVAHSLRALPRRTLP